MPRSFCRATFAGTRFYWVLHWNWNEADHREAERSGLGWTPGSVFNTGINRPPFTFLTGRCSTPADTPREEACSVSDCLVSYGHGC